LHFDFDGAVGRGGGEVPAFLALLVDGDRHAQVIKRLERGEAHLVAGGGKGLVNDAVHRVLDASARADAGPDTRQG
jgi:hypothetical protein